MPRTKAGFIEPMLLLRTDHLPDDPAHWSYQVKFDGYRAVAFKSGGTVHLRSRNNNDFRFRYPAVVHGLTKLPNETVIDGELIALDGDGRPSFNMLQNYGSESTPLLYLIFDVMCFKGRDVTADTLDSRRELLEGRIVPQLAEPVRCADTLDARLPDLILVHPASQWVAEWCKDGSSSIWSGGLAPCAMSNSTAICWDSKSRGRFDRWN
jgi:ATP-dependent DNA ligase